MVPGRRGREPGSPDVGPVDAEAFEALFRRHYAALCSFAASLVAGPDEAEEVVQQVFANLWRTRSGVVIRTSTRAYLYRAVRNLALNRIRDTRVIELHRDSGALAAGDPAPDPAEAVVARESAEALRAAIASLPPRCREVIRLRWIDGLDHAEIAEALGITRKAVESNITRGLRGLRETLGGLTD